MSDRTYSQAEVEDLLERRLAQRDAQRSVELFEKFQDALDALAERMRREERKNLPSLTVEQGEALPKICLAYLAGVADEIRRKALHQTLWGRVVIVVAGLTYLHEIGADRWLLKAVGIVH